MTPDHFREIAAAAKEAQMEMVRQAVQGAAEAGAERHRVDRATLMLADLAKANMASEFYERLGFWIKDFEGSLDQDQEVGVRLVNFGQTVQFFVESLGYHDPSLIVFHGVTPEGQKVTLIQHVSQISFLLIAMKKPDPSEPKRTFGFAPVKKTDEAPDQ